MTFPHVSAPIPHPHPSQSTWPLASSPDMSTFSSGITSFVKFAQVKLTTPFLCDLTGPGTDRCLPWTLLQHFSELAGFHVISLHSKTFGF